jgi:hypothetical protein
MSIDKIPLTLRLDDLFHHIDMGFLNRRLCLSALPTPWRSWYIDHQEPGFDHMTVLSNDHLLVTVLLDTCDTVRAPTLTQALALAQPRQLFRSTERLAPCPELYEEVGVDHAVELDVDYGKPVRICYHTEHLVSSTGKMTLAEGWPGGFVQAIVGLLHSKPDRFEVQPLVIGAPAFDHPRNSRDHSGADLSSLMYIGRVFGEILPEDIDQFSKMKEVEAASANEWMSVMRGLPEATVKEGLMSLLAEPTKKDWAGEANDQFSANVSLLVRHRRCPPAGYETGSSGVVG